MYLTLILLLTGCALIVLIITRETSPLYILPLLALVSLGFMAASLLHASIFLVVFSLVASGFVAWLARDELLSGRPWFWVVVVLAGGASSFFFYRTELAFAQASASIALGSLVAVLLSYNRRWIKIRGQWESKV